MKHSIDENIINTNIEYCIDEYVRLYEDRDILRAKWFKGYSFKQLAAEYKKTDSAVKKIIYGIGDKILIRASKMSTNSTSN